MAHRVKLLRICFAWGTVLFHPKVDPKAAIWRKSVISSCAPWRGEGERDGGTGGGERERERERSERAKGRKK